jgi:hypothetical protein
LFCGPVADSTSEPEVAVPHSREGADDRLTRLEKLVDHLAGEISNLKKRLGE